MKWLILLFACATSLGAYADIYKKVDASGQVTYTDRPIPGAQRMKLGPIPKSAAHSLTISGERKPLPQKNDTGGAGRFPRIDAPTQQKRDAVRHDILQSELRSEEQALTDAATAKTNGEKLGKGELASSPSYLTRIDKLNATLKLHRDNIKALQKELSTVK